MRRLAALGLLDVAARAHARSAQHRRLVRRDGRSAVPGMGRAARRRLDGAGVGGAGGPAAEPRAAPPRSRTRWRICPRARASRGWRACTASRRWCVSAVARRDWAAAARYARVGQGRLIRLLALVARGIGGEAVPRACSCGPRWLLAPMRRTTFPLVRALARRDAVAAGARPALPPPPAAAHARHVALLEAAARHEEIRADEVFALAAAWQGAIDDAALARLQARALELGIRDGAARALALREQVLGELALLLARADGELARAPAHAFGETLAGRAREQQLARIRDALGGAGRRCGRAGAASAGGVGALADAARGLGARGAGRGPRGAGGALAEHGARQPVELLLRAVAPARRARGVGRVRDVRLAGRSRRIRRRSGRRARQPRERPHRARELALATGSAIRTAPAAARRSRRQPSDFLMNAAARRRRAGCVFTGPTHRRIWHR